MKITPKHVSRFEKHLIEEERSAATVEKYLRDIRGFLRFLGGADASKERVLAYKAQLGGAYAVSGANSMLAAINAFFRFCGWHELCVKPFKVQRQAFCPEEKELTRAEYQRLVAAAERDERLSLVIQTICGTGIRVSELQYITVEALQKGEAAVSCKGKTRRIFIVAALRKKLIRYARRRGIASGAVFLTKNGRPLSRTAVWRGMKALCAAAAVDPRKVFPHNLRHLFARTFYSLEKDIAKLADILGHASIDTTRIYIVTTGAEHRRKMEHMKLVV